VAAGVAGSVLIVDDDPVLVSELRTALAPYDVVVDDTDDPPGAVKLLGERKYCGMVLDLVLKDGSGFDVLHHLVKENLTVPTVVVSSKLPSYVREMLDAERVKLVFPKPVEPRLLAAIILGMCGIQS
jgi:DNA-binding response OmpR family regulator